MVTTRPFWREDSPLPEHDGPLPAEADVAVIGAGFTGLNAAREIAAAGHSVVVLDAGKVGAGASSVNGGMVNHGLKAATTKVYKSFGPQLGREFWDASLASIDLVEKLVLDEGIDCGFVRNGAAELGYSKRDLTGFGHEADWMRENLDFDTDLYGPDRIHQVVGSDAFHCAMVDHVGAGLQPASYVAGLAGAAERRGAVIVDRARVLRVSRTTTGFQLLTERGRLAGGQVLYATNGYTESVPSPELRRRVIPVGSYIVVTEPLPLDVAERLVPEQRMLWTSRRFINYFRRTPDNRILMGGRNDLSTDLDLVESAARLEETTLEIFPELADVAFTNSWNGKLGITFDLMPHIGRIDGAWYALGYGGHGVGISTYVGAEVGRLIAGTQDRSPFAEIPHPTRPYYREKTWFLPLAARWYRFLDTIGR
jgi:glycine/D-amino acid oxidase-like deaminating enzyme